MKRLISFVVALFFVFAATAMAQGGLLIHTDKDVYQYGEEIRVNYYNAPGYPRDWICIVPAGSADTEAGDYKYIPEGAAQGELFFKAPRPGQYEARAYYNYTPFRYLVTARYRFTVAGDVYGGTAYEYEDDGYYDVPIVYGAPRYYRPPIAVTFAFDYFTYEMYGPYVDIVFWRDGRRYRQEPWHHHGRRMTSGYLHSNPWHDRVRGADLSRHRDRLREHQHIIQPDSYYGPKMSPDRNRRPAWQSGRDDRRPQWGQQKTRSFNQRPQFREQRPSRDQGPFRMKENPKFNKQQQRGERRHDRDGFEDRPGPGNSHHR